jgi:hypothetical protein
MAIHHTGKNKHQRAGRPTPHGTGEQVEETSAPENEPETGPRRDALTDEYKNERGDVPGSREKSR